MCETTAASKEQARVCFGDLGNAFKILHHYSKQWNEDDIISVMEELISKVVRFLTDIDYDELYESIIELDCIKIQNIALHGFVEIDLVKTLRGLDNFFTSFSWSVVSLIA